MRWRPYLEMNALERKMYWAVRQDREGLERVNLPISRRR
jgi:hypothetical protein